MTTEQAWHRGFETGRQFHLGPSRRQTMGFQGNQQARLEGQGREFLDYRDYQPGDDLRNIDWGAFARSDRVLVKRFHSESMPRFELILDGSGSMAFESGDKAKTASFTAGLLSGAAASVGYDLTFFLAREHLSPLPFRQIERALQHDFDGTKTIATLISAFGCQFRNLSRRVLITDLMWPGDPGTTIAALSKGASDFTIICILSEWERNPNLEKNELLVDIESGQASRDAHSLASTEDYHQRLNQHLDGWQKALQEQGHQLVFLDAELDGNGVQSQLLDSLLLEVVR